MAAAGAHARRGFWLTPGQAEAELTLLPDGLLTFQCKDKPISQPHGKYAEWSTSTEAIVLNVVFNHEGNDSIQTLRTHLLGKMIPGVYRCNFKHIVFVIPDEILAAPARLLLGNDDVTDADTKHLCLWLHPGRDPALLSLRHDRTIMFRKMDGNFTPNAIGQANGYYEYNPSNNMWMTYFHHTGQEAAKVGTALHPVAGNINVCRAIGDHQREHSLQDIKKWHIVAVFLEPKEH